MTEDTVANVRMTFQHHGDLPACTLNLEALQAVERVIPSNFKKTWTAIAQAISVEGTGVDEVLAQLPADARISSLRLWAYSSGDGGRSSTVSFSIDRYSTWLSVETGSDPVRMRGIEESILDICRKRRRFWQKALKGRVGLSLCLGSIALSWVGTLLLLLAPHSLDDRLLAAVYGTLEVPAITTFVAWLIASWLPPIRVVLAGTGRSGLEWRQVSVNFLISLAAGLVLLPLAFLLGKGCG